MISQVSANNYNNSVTFGALPKKYKVVDECLIRGPHPHVWDVYRLKKEGVTQIFDFREKSLKGFKFAERLACKLFGIDYTRIKYSFLHEMFPTAKDYSYIAQKVQENGKKGGITLLHCNSGTHRTALMSAFYKITKGEPLEECMKRPDYKETVQEAVKEHILDTNFFSRNQIIDHTRNPIKKLQNRFNNKVDKGIRRAFAEFMDFLKAPID
ncbi:MAG: hypothetical protein K6E29_05895 [Cyanobacteria bacterium RUI128]|nr:hypothetical protein [Cyanobacteria bacterium RUI128]